jgi:predicted PurR-regulated permease PerM
LTGKTRNFLIIITASLLVLISAFFIIRNRDILWSILKPFVIGIIIAYVFNPLVEALIKRGLGRMAAVLIVYSAVLSAVAGLLSFLLPAAVPS